MLSRLLQLILLLTLTLTLHLSAADNALEDSAAPGSVSTITLKTMVLANPGKVLSASDVKPRSNYPIYFINDTIRPGNRLDFDRKKSQPQTVNIGDTSLSIDPHKSRFRITQGKDTQEVAINKDSVDPATITLTSGRKYLLAFPLFRSFSSTASLYYRSGLIKKGMLGEESISIYDDNLDGKYSKGQDTYRTGNYSIFCPLDALITTGSKVYYLDNLTENGKTLSYHPYDKEVTSFGLDFKALGNVQALCVYGSEETGLNFITTGLKNSVAVPPGPYKLLYGLVKDPSGFIAGIMPGKMEAFEVKANHPELATLGAPFVLSFSTQIQGSNLIIDPNSIKVMGNRGEEYVNTTITGKPRVSLVKGDGQTQFLGSFGFG
ncbi:MAG: hypothetical protein JXA52_00145 [Planctomycetes bacterium]|nr:hypothetical protein [Planctomycetota bacterium]